MPDKTTTILPNYLERSQRTSQAKQAKLAALDALVGIAKGSLTNATDDELRELGMARYAISTSPSIRPRVS